MQCKLTKRIGCTGLSSQVDLDPGKLKHESLNYATDTLGEKLVLSLQKSHICNNCLDASRSWWTTSSP